MSTRETPPLVDSSSSAEPPAPPVSAVCLTAGPVREPITDFSSSCSSPNQPNPGLREALVESKARSREEARRGARLSRRSARTGPSTEGTRAALCWSRPRRGRSPWREALVTPGDDCPIGLVLATSDHGRVVLVHECSATWARPNGTSSGATRRWSSRATPTGRPSARLERGIEGLHRGVGAGAPSTCRSWIRPCCGAPTAWSACSSEARPRPRAICCEKASTESTCSCCRPRSSRTARNYGDVEFVVYLNFFLRRGVRTRIAGAPRQRRPLTDLLTLTIFGVFDPGAPEHAVVRGTPPALWGAGPGNLRPLPAVPRDLRGADRSPTLPPP